MFSEQVTIKKSKTEASADNIIPKDLLREADAMIGNLDQVYALVTIKDKVILGEIKSTHRLVHESYTEVATLLSSIIDETDAAARETLLRDLEDKYHRFKLAHEASMKFFAEHQEPTPTQEPAAVDADDINSKDNNDMLDNTKETEKNPHDKIGDKEVAADIEFYRFWQNSSDSSFLFAKGWQGELPKIRKDIERSLQAAGYSMAEVRKHMRTLFPLFKIIQRQPDHQTRNLNKYKKDLHTKVSALLAGREPNPEVFSRKEVDTVNEEEFAVFNQLPSYESVDEYEPEIIPAMPGEVDTNEKEAEYPGLNTIDSEKNPATAEAMGSATKTPEATADKTEPAQEKVDSEEGVKDLVEALAAARAGWDDLKSKIPPHQFVFEQLRVEIVLQAIGSILNDPDYSVEKKVEKFTKQVEHLAKLVNVIKESLGISAADETVTTSEKSTTPDSTAASVTPDTTPDSTTAGTSTDAPPAATVTGNSSPDTIREKVFDTRREMGAELSEAKKTMLAFEKQYNEALSAYYKDRTLGQKLRDGFRQWRGKDDGYGEALRTLQQQYDTAADAYKSKLLEKLRFRSQTQAGVNRFQADGETVAKALDDRLAVKGERTVVGTDGTERVFGVKSESEIRATAIEEIGRESRMRKIMELMRKNPKATRMIGLGVAAGTGALAGGIPTALMASARWAVATFGGAYAAEKVFQRSQKEVDASEAKLLETIASQDKNLSVTERRKSLRMSEATVRKAKVRQRSKAVLTALAVGGSASYGAATIGNYFTPETATQTPLFGADNETAPTIPPAAEATLAPFVQVGEVEILSETAGAQVVRNIELLSASSVNSIPETEVAGVFAYIKLATQDILEAHPNMAVAEVERSLLEKLNSHYGANEWWQQAGVSEVRIGAIESAVVAASQATEQSVETAVEMYTVRPGDSIWRIAEQNNTELLADLNTAERNQVLSELRERINQSPGLQQEIGVTSGNADLIRIGDNLNLNQIEEELRDIIADRPSRGDLPVVGDSSEQSVPIINNVAEVRPEVASVNVVTGATPVVESTPIYPTIDPNQAPLPAHKDPMFIVPGETMSVLPNVRPIEGNYLNTPLFREYITQHFGSEQAFNRLVLQNVAALEGETYDFMNRLLQEFQSPFQATPQELLENRTFELSTMTIGEIAQWRTQFFDNPDALRDFAIENGFKYETLRAWLDVVDTLTAKEAGLPHTSSTTFGDLYGRFVAEQAMMEKFSRGGAQLR